MESSAERRKWKGGFEERLDRPRPMFPTRSVIRGERGMHRRRYVRAEFGRGEGSRPMVRLAG
eukprot:1682111-Pleurochrysis_carterae.AAC.1